MITGSNGSMRPIRISELVVTISRACSVVMAVPARGATFRFLTAARSQAGSTSLCVNGNVGRLGSPRPELGCFRKVGVVGSVVGVGKGLSSVKVGVDLGRVSVGIMVCPRVANSDGPGRDSDSPGQCGTGTLTSVMALGCTVLGSAVGASLPGGTPMGRLGFALAKGVGHCM